MLQHTIKLARNPERVVALGAAGFVGASCISALHRKGISTVGLTRDNLDLLAGNAADRLQEILNPSDSLLFISVKAPCKNASMLTQNIRMAETVCTALEKVSVSHVVYVSSDAVYRDSKVPLNEDSCAEPSSLHGAMHLARELMLKSISNVSLAILRPTLIYGAADPHNGYGPNRFRRLCADQKDIVLFGEGEEQRDHVLIDDVADIACRALQHRSTGTLNIASGQVHSFRSIAEQIATLHGGGAKIHGTPRHGPMPHGGYRAFDPAATYRAFPDFRYTPLQAGLRRVHDEQQISR